MGLLDRVEQGTAEPALKSIKTSDSPPKTLKEKIAQFQGNRENINCILFDIPGNTGDKEGFCRRIAKMLEKAGTVIPLETGRPLVLLPLSMDRELVAHRISKSFDSAPVFSFEADNPEIVINRINSLP